jgi:hypothetical protein
MAGEVIFARLSQLEAFGMKVVIDFAALTARVQSLERAGGQPNIIEKILVNGIQLAVDGNKAVNFSVPTKTSQLKNDTDLQNGTQVNEKLSTKADSGHDHDGRYFTKEQVNSAIAGKADTGHTHDDRYYTEAEMDGKLAGKSNTGHTHNTIKDIGDGRTLSFAYSKDGLGYESYSWLAGWNGNELRPVHKRQFATAGHTHDDRYYTESEMDTKLGGKADAEHSHDDLYYAKSEVDAKFSDVAAPAWDSISGKPTAFTPTDHTHDDRYYTEAEIDQKLQGLPTAGHKHTKSDITDFPALGTAAAKNVGDFAAASHTHNYAGSSSAGGAANSANKLNKNAGSATQGVYFKDGVPVAMPHTLGKSVPADAKFTDTNTWRGVQDNLTSTATDQSLSANQGKVLKGLVDGKAASSHTHDDRYYTESEMNTKLNGKANSSHTHNYAGSGSAGGTANSVNGLTFAAQTTDPGAGSALTTNKVLIVYV